MVVKIILTSLVGLIVSFVLALVFDGNKRGETFAGFIAICSLVGILAGILIKIWTA